MCYSTSKPLKTLSPSSSSNAKMPKVTHFSAKTCTVSLSQHQFATLYLFHACTGRGTGEGGKSTYYRGLEDPLGAGPVAQDNDKRNNIPNTSTELFGRLANRYFVNGYFEFQFVRETHILGELEGCQFLPEGSSLFPPFVFLSSGLLGTFHRFCKYPFAKYPFASF